MHMYSNRRDRGAEVIAYGAVFVCLAMIFSYIESVLSAGIIIPGFKAGFANIVVITAFYMMGWKYAFLVNIIRIIILGILFGNPFSLIFSISGGLLAFLLMYVIWRSGKFSETGVSITGAVFHNVGQLIAAVAVFGTAGILLWLPVYTAAGIGAGIITGMISHAVLKRIGHLKAGRMEM